MRTLRCSCRKWGTRGARVVVQWAKPPPSTLACRLRAQVQVLAAPFFPSSSLQTCLENSGREGGLGVWAPATQREARWSSWLPASARTLQSLSEPLQDHSVSPSLCHSTLQMKKLLKRKKMDKEKMSFPCEQFPLALCPGPARKRREESAKEV